MRLSLHSSQTVKKTLFQDPRHRLVIQVTDLLSGNKSYMTPIHAQKGCENLVFFLNVQVLHVVVG